MAFPNDAAAAAAAHPMENIWPPLLSVQNRPTEKAAYSRLSSGQRKRRYNVVLVVVVEYIGQRSTSTTDAADVAAAGTRALMCRLSSSGSNTRLGGN